VAVELGLTEPPKLVRGELVQPRGNGVGARFGPSQGDRPAQPGVVLGVAERPRLERALRTSPRRAAGRHPLTCWPPVVDPC